MPNYSSDYDYLASNPSYSNLVGTLQNRYSQGPQSQGLKGAFSNAGYSGAQSSFSMGSASNPLGYASLANLLMGQGKIDPRVMGQQLQSVNQGTQQAQTSAAGSLTGRGWGNLGLGKALQASIGQGGENRKAGIRYQDAADSYGRRQQDLGLFDQLVAQKQQDYGALGAGQYQADRARGDQKNAATTGAIAAVIGAILCKVARELYGDESEKFQSARHYMLNAAPVSLSGRYLAHGPELAEAVRTNPAVRERLTPVFDEFARRGAEMRAA